MKKNKTISKSVKLKQLSSLKKAFSLSMFIHVLLFWVILGMPIGCHGGGKGDSNDKQENKQSNISGASQEEIKDKNPDPVEVKVVNVHVEKSEEQIAYEAAVKKQEECKPFFGGIGVRWSREDGIIEKVYKYYPAWAAGIKEGDRLLIDAFDIRGEVGTEVVVSYIRDGVKHEVTIKRGRICLDDAIREEGGEDKQ